MVICSQKTLSALVGAVIFIATAITALAAPPSLEQQDLFTAGEAGVKLYRIPGIVVTASNTVLAYCEGRRDNAGDWAESDIFLRRSTNAGYDFAPAIKLAHFGARIGPNPVAVARNVGSTNDQTVHNAVAIVDWKTGEIHFLYCVNYERCFYLRSSDDGLTFSKPVEITATFEQFRPEYDCHIIATGPGHGIQLSNGRLIVPVWLSTGEKIHAPSVSATIYSDDHGRTWHRGTIALAGTPETPNPNENMAAQLADGSVMLNIRTVAERNRRVVVTSPDGITNWSGAHFDDALLEPICMASLVRYTVEPGAKNRLLFSNPDNLTGGKGGGKPGTSRARRNLSVKLSYDEGKTWPVNKTLEKNIGGYSDLAILHNGDILCFYESAPRLMLARFNLEWLTDGKDSLADK